jgi:hypothetical protein
MQGINNILAECSLCDTKPHGMDPGVLPSYMHVIVADAVWEFLSIGKVVKFFDLLMSNFFSGARPAVPMGVNDEADPLKFLSGGASLVVPLVFGCLPPIIGSNFLLHHLILSNSFSRFSFHRVRD